MKLLGPRGLCLELGGVGGAMLPRGAAEHCQPPGGSGVPEPALTRRDGRGPSGVSSTGPILAWGFKGGSQGAEWRAGGFHQRERVTEPRG